LIGKPQRIELIRFSLHIGFISAIYALWYLGRMFNLPFIDVIPPSSLTELSTYPSTRSRTLMVAFIALILILVTLPKAFVVFFFAIIFFV
jgi:hypothetical protein